MTTTLSAGAALNERALPDDLSSYLGKKTLVKFILEALEDFDASTIADEHHARESAAFQPAMMLTLLTYCYVTGTYGSADVQLDMQHDRMVRYLCARNYPDNCAIRSFRRYHHDEIVRCLSIVLQRVWKLRFCGEDAKPMAGLSIPAAFTVAWVDTKSVPDFEREAERRITVAIRADSMAADV
jgi:transposase